MKFDRPDAESCWPWRAGHTPFGYGVFYIRGKLYRAHRISYSRANGEIEVGLELDHLCRNPPCVNPLHLEPVTTAENLYRGETLPGINRRKMECPEGHPYAGSNLIQRRDGHRECRTCKYAANRERSRRRKATHG